MTPPPKPPKEHLVSHFLEDLTPRLSIDQWLFKLSSEHQRFWKIESLVYPLAF